MAPAAGKWQPKPLSRRGHPLLSTDDLFVYVSVLIDDAIKAGAIVVPARPGGSRIMRAWNIAPAAVSEHDVGTDLLEAGPPARDLLADNGLNGKALAASQATRGTAVLVPPTRDQHKTTPAIPQKAIAQWRDRIETTFKEITDQMELARHGAHTFGGLLARTTATIAAHTLIRACPAAP